MSGVGASARSGSADWVLGDVLDFLRLLWALDHALQRRSKQMRVSLGVTGPQRFVIRIVGRFPGISAGRLAEILHVHPSTLTGILGRLERRGWIRRRSDPRDRRRSLLGLTPKGRRLDVDLEGTVEAAVRAVLVAIPPRKMEATAEVLRRLAGSLESARAELRQ
jgi:DNA-binding MarR family transcriptional regulator